MATLVALLIALVIVAVVLLGTKLVLDWAGAQGAVRQIVFLIVGAICLLLLIAQLGVVGRPVVVF